ncbi:MAG: transposase [Candidatus Bipolaricaulota bacterium]
MKLVRSDANSRLKAVIAKELPGSSWQRCRAHFMRYFLGKAPKASQEVVVTLVCSIFAQPNAQKVWG